MSFHVLCPFLAGTLEAEKPQLGLKGATVLHFQVVHLGPCHSPVSLLMLFIEAGKRCASVLSLMTMEGRI